MSLEGIILYSVRACHFAILVELLWLVFSFWRYRNWSVVERRQKRSVLIWRSILVFYLAALIQITVIRGGIGLSSFLAAPHDSSTIQLVPLIYTIQQAEAGWWAVIYPVCGNIIWFLPLGFLLPQARFSLGKYWYSVLLCGLCLSLTIEILQWIFGSGISDIDDVLFNSLGVMCGFFILRFIKVIIKKKVFDAAKKFTFRQGKIANKEEKNK